MASAKLKPRLTPIELAELWGVGKKKIYVMIDVGEIEAVDISLPGSLHKRWVIPVEAVEAYEKRRSNLTEDARAQRRRRVRTLADPYADVLS